jgi:hypothetical protein
MIGDEGKLDGQPSKIFQMWEEQPRKEGVQLCRMATLWLSARCVTLTPNERGILTKESMKNDPAACAGTNPVFKQIPNTLEGLASIAMNRVAADDEWDVYSFIELTQKLFESFVPSPVLRRGKMVNIRVLRPGTLGFAHVAGQRAWVELLRMLFEWKTLPPMITQGEEWPCLELYCDISIAMDSSSRGVISASPTPLRNMPSSKVVVVTSNDSVARSTDALAGLFQNRNLGSAALGLTGKTARDKVRAVGSSSSSSSSTYSLPASSSSSSSFSDVANRSLDISTSLSHHGSGGGSSSSLKSAITIIKVAEKTDKGKSKSSLSSVSSFSHVGSHRSGEQTSASLSHHASGGGSSSSGSNAQRRSAEDEDEDEDDSDPCERDGGYTRHDDEGNGDKGIGDANEADMKPERVRDDVVDDVDDDDDDDDDDDGDDDDIGGDKDDDNDDDDNDEDEDEDDEGVVADSQHLGKQNTASSDDHRESDMIARKKAIRAKLNEWIEMKAKTMISGLNCITGNATLICDFKGKKTGVKNAKDVAVLHADEIEKVISYPAFASAIAKGKCPKVAKFKNTVLACRLKVQCNGNPGVCECGGSDSRQLFSCQWGCIPGSFTAHKKAGNSAKGKKKAGLGKLGSPGLVQGLKRFLADAVAGKQAEKKEESGKRKAPSVEEGGAGSGDGRSARREVDKRAKTGSGGAKQVRLTEMVLCLLKRLAIHLL